MPSDPGREQSRSSSEDDGRLSPRVLVSYAHDDPHHEQEVRKFWYFLREQGIDARLDLPAADQRQEWPQWMTDEVRAADRILIVASPEYKHRSQSDADPEIGRGVQWEARLIRARIYANQRNGLQLAVPVVLPGCSPHDIPDWLSPSSTTYYVVTDYTMLGAEPLLRLLTSQPAEIQPPRGKRPQLPPHSAPEAIRNAGAVESETTAKALAQVISSQQAMRAASSWTSGQWRQRSTALAVHLTGLETALEELHIKRDAAHDVTRQTIELDSAIAEGTELTGKLRASLGQLQDDRLPPAGRAREFSLFTRWSEDLQRLAPRLRTTADAAFPAPDANDPDLAGLEVAAGLPELNYVAEQQPWYSPSIPAVEEVEHERIEELRSAIDAVLITANERELLAVLKQLTPPPRKRKILLVYWDQETYYLGKFGSHLAVVTKCRIGSVGEGSVTLAATLAQHLWSPRAVIMVGVAFGKDRQKQQIADVIVASQIVSYEQQRVGEQIEFRGPVPPANGTLLNRFENAADWNFERPDGNPSRLIVGPVLSGEKLVDDPEFKQKLFDQFPSAVGGEMEGAGLCAATGRIGTAWILVKGICDWADGETDNRHQPLAAAAATSLVLRVLSRRTVLRDINRPPRRAY